MFWFYLRLSLDLGVVWLESFGWKFAKGGNIGMDLWVVFKCNLYSRYRITKDFWIHEHPARTCDPFLLSLMSLLGVIRSQWSYLIRLSPPTSTSHRVFKFRPHHRTMTTERFLADRAAPLCSLNVAKSFEHLRSVFPSMAILKDSVDVLMRTAVPRKRSTPITWPRLPGQVLVSSRASGHHRHKNSTTSWYSLSVTMESWVTWKDYR